MLLCIWPPHLQVLSLSSPPSSRYGKPERKSPRERGSALAPRCTLPPPEIHLRSTYGGSSQETSSWAGSGGGEGRGKVPRARRGGV